MVPESGGPGFKSQVSNILAAWPWGSYSTFLNSSIFFNKMGVIAMPTSWNSLED